MAVKGLGHRDHRVGSVVKLLVLLGVLVGGFLVMQQGLGAYQSNAAGSKKSYYCRYYEKYCYKNRNSRLCKSFRLKCKTIQKITPTPSPTSGVEIGDPLDITQIPTPPVNGGLKICPDQWIVNRLPSSDGSTVSNEYFIVKKDRRELSEFDLSWVKVNCFVKPYEVY